MQWVLSKSSVPLASSCAYVHIEGWCSSGFCCKFWYESSKLYFEVSRIPFLRRSQCIFREDSFRVKLAIELCAALAAKSAEGIFYKQTSVDKAWLENRMDKLAQLANSLHSLTLICTKGGSQSSHHKLNQPKHGHDSLSAVHSHQPAQILLQVGFSTLFIALQRQPMFHT